MPRPKRLGSGASIKTEWKKKTKTFGLVAHVLPPQFVYFAGFLCTQPSVQNWILTWLTAQRATPIRNTRRPIRLSASERHCHPFCALPEGIMMRLSDMLSCVLDIYTPCWSWYRYPNICSESVFELRDVFNLLGFSYVAVELIWHIANIGKFDRE